ncbi:MAG: FtsX-like permease family protein, partial [Gammaproteobacteria bacterium]|nr:FtsX-like permease family protein [Gammaproteobacteria bacterium]
MKILSYSARNLLREWRSGELMLLFVSMIVAVGALSSVGFFTDRVREAVNRQAGESLAADLVVYSRNTISEQYVVEAGAAGLNSARILSFPSVVTTADRSQLAEIRAVTPGYPLRGRVRIADQAYGITRVADAIPAAGEVWAEPRLLGALGVNVGDIVSVGQSRLRISAVLDYAPDQGWNFVDIAPTLLMNQNDVEATGLLGPASRVRHRLLIAGDSGAVRDFREQLEPALQRGESLLDIRDGRPEMRNAVDRAGRFLSLAALVSVLLAGVAIAMAARRYAIREFDTVAILKCLGAQRRAVLLSYVLQLFWIGLVAGVIGVILGYAAQAGLVWLLKDILNQDLPLPTLTPAPLAVMLGMIILAGFGLPPLLQLGRTPPIRVLRRDLGPPQLPGAVVYLTAIASIVGLLWWQTGDTHLTAYVLGGAAGGAMVLALGAFLLIRALSGIRGRVGIAWRYGVANIVRRGRDSIIQVMAFGLGMMVLLLLGVVRNDLLQSWRASLPENAPNHFLINIQPDEREGIREFFEARQLAEPELSAIVRARLVAVNDVAVEDLEFNSERARRFAEREANLTWSGTLQTSNEIVAGEWWTENEFGQALTSIEVELAGRMGWSVGDKLTYDIAGEQVTVEIASLRSVRWDSFQPNFFIVMPPDLLNDYAATFITSLYIPQEQSPQLLELVHQWPSVTIIDLDAILNQVRSVMDQASLAVEYVFLFTLAAGVLVLLA